MSGKQCYLICYDIRDPGRLARVARYLVRRALRVQYSVFLAALNPSALQEVLGDLALLIDHRQDDLRCYPLARQSAMVRLGRATFPDAVVLV